MRIEACFDARRSQGSALSLVPAGTDATGAWTADDRHPRFDEVAFSALLIHAPHQFLDAAALGMTEDDDMGYAEIANGEFEGGAGSMVEPVRLERRQDVGGVAADEQLAGFGRVEDRRIDTRVRTGNDHSLRVLPLLLRLEKLRPPFAVVAAEPPEIREKAIDGRHLCHLCDSRPRFHRRSSGT
jgi:hypothetical protein